MKYTLLLIWALILCGCGSRNSRESAVTATEQNTKQAVQIAKEQGTAEIEEPVLTADSIAVTSPVPIGTEKDADHLRLLRARGIQYIEEERYADALALTDEMLKLLGDEKNTCERGAVYYDKALCYVYLKDDVNALEYTMRALAIFDKLGMQDTEEYKDAEYLIGAIEQIAEQKADW
jgi:tetratricopeptide (TPR) repeat protein